MRRETVSKFVCVLPLRAASIMLAGCLQDSRKPAAAEPSRNGGYSILHETIVDMAWPQVEEAAKDGAALLMATAVIEEHGPHMSCGIDTYLFKQAGWR